MSDALFTRYTEELDERQDLILTDQVWTQPCHDRNAYGVRSETDPLEAVLLADPSDLAIVPVNSVSKESLRKGLCCSSQLARAEHRMLEEQFARLGIRTHIVPAKAGLADLAFTRDTSLMTPWGLLQLRPSARHRMAEAPHVAETVRRLGYPILGRIERGRVEGGDISMIREGIVVIGCSGDRTDAEGAAAVADIFEARGWRAIVYHLDPHFLHLDTIFSMVDGDKALACVDVLDDGFLLQLEALGIQPIPVSYKEARKLGCNVLSLGKKRVLSTRDNTRVNARLRALGHMVIEADIGQFTRCGGGIHCLTMPLARR